MRICLIFLLTLTISLSVFAHKPADLKLQLKKNTINIEIKHIVSNRHKDFIDKVEIIVNGEKPIIKRFHFQKTNSEQTLDLEIPKLSEVKTLTIKAYSKKGGHLIKDFDIQKMIEEK